MKKSEKVQQEIERTEEKIAVLQRRLADLKREKIEAENAEYVEMIRDLDCKPNEVQALLRAIKTGDMDYLLKHMQKQEKSA